MPDNRDTENQPKQSSLTPEASSDGGEIPKTDEEWKQRLSPEQFAVCRQKATEHPFTGQYCHTKTKGTYKCVCCGTELFRSETKYDSGTGWPSFWTPIDESCIATEPDHSLGRVRTEVLCRRCGAHLGHVFDDGPPPTHKRYCINSMSLRLVEDK